MSLGKYRGKYVQEIVAGLVTVLDVVALYLLLPAVKQRFLLALWTGVLHMALPLIGFQLGDWAVSILLEWGEKISSILLFLIGLHILFSSQKRQISTLHPAILAFTASIDAFSVSVSFGMLNLHKYLFIFTAGIGSFLLSYISLTIARKTSSYRGTSINIIAGLSLITISIFTMIK